MRAAARQTGVDDKKRSDESAAEVATWNLSERAHARRAAERMDEAERTAEREMRKSVQDSYLAVASASLGRSVRRGELLTTVAAAVGTLYTGMLTIVFAATDDANAELPSRGLIPAVFIGLALVFAVAYLAHLRQETQSRELLPTGEGIIPQQRLAEFLDWASDGVHARAHYLRTAIVSLGIGVALMPLPFVEIWNVLAWGLAVVGGLGLAVVLRGRGQVHDELSGLRRQVHDGLSGLRGQVHDELSGIRRQVHDELNGLRRKRSPDPPGETEETAPQAPRGDTKRSASWPQKVWWRFTGGGPKKTEGAGGEDETQEAQPADDAPAPGPPDGADNGLEGDDAKPQAD